MTAVRRAALGASVLIVVGTVLVACGSSGGSTPSALDPKGSESRHIAGVWWLMFGVGAAVYVIVAGFVIFGATRGRRSERADSRVPDGAFIWIGGIVVPVLILTMLGIVTVTTTNTIRRTSAHALRIDVTGKRWWWAVRYPSEHVTTANEIHVPVGRPIEVRITSTDVIHSFWVPQLAGKVDAIPGQPNELRFTAEQTGHYLGLCAEYCGAQHAHMGFSVDVEPAGDFGRWIARESRPAAEPSSELQARGEMIFMRSSCAGCHTIEGTPAYGRVGPDLTHLSDRQTIGARAATNTASHLAKWIVDPGHVKPGVLMPPHQVSRDEADAIVAYLLQQGADG